MSKKAKNGKSNRKSKSSTTIYAKEQKAFNRRYREECGECTTRKASPEELAKYFG